MTRPCRHTPFYYNHINLSTTLSTISPFRLIENIMRIEVIALIYHCYRDAGQSLKQTLPLSRWSYWQSVPLFPIVHASLSMLKLPLGDHYLWPHFHATLKLSCQSRQLKLAVKSENLNRIKRQIPWNICLLAIVRQTVNFNLEQTRELQLCDRPAIQVRPLLGEPRVRAHCLVGGQKLQVVYPNSPPGPHSAWLTCVTDSSNPPLPRHALIHLGHFWRENSEINVQSGVARWCLMCIQV